MAFINPRTEVNVCMKPISQIAFIYNWIKRKFSFQTFIAAKFQQYGHIISCIKLNHLYIHVWKIYNIKFKQATFILNYNEIIIHEIQLQENSI